jgi:uridine kinase
MCFAMCNSTPDTENDSVASYIAACINSKFKDATATILIAVGGPGGCGKSSFCKMLSNALSSSSVISLDNYRIPRKLREHDNLYGSHPDANRIDLLLEHIEKLHQGKQINYPVYDTVTGTVLPGKPFTPKEVVLLDGEIATYTQIVTRCDFSIHLDADPDVLLARRVKRDTEQHGYSLEKVRSVFEKSMRDNETYGIYGKKHADINLVCKEDFSIEIIYMKCL